MPHFLDKFSAHFPGDAIQDVPFGRLWSGRVFIAFAADTFVIETVIMLIAAFRV